ncbi:MAG: phosphatidylglycerophosphatase A [Alphaproteobacteria bacterium]|nr:phosphatidylglycerophosphatase A [Alphaproteobacteria bacterium]MBL6936412.1 phosphatidylglycerophosphatase A [Alphaproteobacteria bacterium]MBL7098537.1 phosphatidylglycerophosphatase A [Alphaproteobacteria bacterium]
MIATVLSTWFGVGFLRPAPGTIASAVALPFAWLILWKLGPAPLAGASLVAFLTGVWSTGAYAARTGGEDPSECVIDEVAGQWLACATAPLTPLAFGIAFILFRFFDITKLWPVSLGERLRGGWGIMADDMIAGALSAIVVAALRWRGLI